MEEIYISSVNIISRRKEWVVLSPGISRWYGLGGIPWSDDTLKNSVDICSEQIHLREYSYPPTIFVVPQKPLLVASGSY